MTNIFPRHKLPPSPCQVALRSSARALRPPPGRSNHWLFWLPLKILKSIGPVLDDGWVSSNGLNEVGLETPKNMRPPAQKTWTVPLSGCNLDSMEDSVPGPTDNHYQGVLNVLVGDAFLFYDLGCWVRAHVVSSTCMAWIETIETKF